ncbi:hypothetical protein TOPH_07389, partial [Tolypocladium ophioglossoides CBS 100239]
MKTPNNANVFTCTFCYNISAGPPHVLGRCARLACTACYAMLLDLSICWVCGEMIFRGDECVSFGWCFWHRACYGCLLCGSRMICAGVPVRALFEDVVGLAEGAARGREVMAPPLCAMCMVDVEVDGLSEEAVVQKGLRRVEAVDGGVTRKRWAMKEGQRTRARHTRRSTGTRPQDPPPETGGDGTASHAFNMDSPSMYTTWVDMNDPINGLSFRPSPLKP